MAVQCKCSGFNDDCVYCGGTGYRPEEPKRIILGVKETLKATPKRTTPKVDHSKPIKRISKALNKKPTIPPKSRINNKWNNVKKKVKKEKKVKKPPVTDLIELEFMNFWQRHLSNIPTDTFGFKACFKKYRLLTPAQRLNFKRSISRKKMDNSEQQMQAIILLLTS